MMESSSSSSSQPKLRNNALSITNFNLSKCIKDVGAFKPTTETFRAFCPPGVKDDLCCYFLVKHTGKKIIFCKYNMTIRTLSHLLRLLGWEPYFLFSYIEKNEKEQILKNFENDENGILVTNDNSVRDVDLPPIQHILHYDAPESLQSYIARNLRVTRGASGYTLILTDQSGLDKYVQFCRSLNRDDSVHVYFIEEDMLRTLKEKVVLAKELMKLEEEISKVYSSDRDELDEIEEADDIVDATSSDVL